MFFRFRRRIWRENIQQECVRMIKKQSYSPIYKSNGNESHTLPIETQTHQSPEDNRTSSRPFAPRERVDTSGSVLSASSRYNPSLLFVQSVLTCEQSLATKGLPTYRLFCHSHTSICLAISSRFALPKRFSPSCNAKTRAVPGPCEVSRLSVTTTASSETCGSFSRKGGAG